MSGGRLKVALAVAAALVAAVAIYREVGRSDSTRSATPADAAPHAAETAPPSDTDGSASRGTADSRLSHVPFVDVPPAPDGLPRPTPPADARRIVVEAVFEDGDPVVGCVVEAAPLAESEGGSTAEQDERADGPNPAWDRWDDRLRYGLLDGRGRAELFVPPYGRFVVRNTNEGFSPAGTYPAEYAEEVPFRSEVAAPDARLVRIVVPAATLSMTVLDQHGRPVVRRPFVFVDADVVCGGGSRRLTDAHGRIRFRVAQSGQVNVYDYGKTEERLFALRRTRIEGEGFERPVRFPANGGSYFVDEVRVDGERVDAKYRSFRADVPGEVFVRMRTLPLAVVRVVDADGRAEGLADVRLDVGFAGKPYRFTLDDGRAAPDGTATIRVACDGLTLAVDAPVTTLRWRIRSPTGREERVVELPVSLDDTLVDAGTVKLASHRTWKLRLFDAQGRALSGRDLILASIPAEGADPQAECALEDRSSEFESNAEATVVHPRVEDAYLRVRVRSAPNKACDVRIDHPAAAIDGPGQRVVCTHWRALSEPADVRGRRAPVGKPRGTLVVRVFDEDGDPAPNVALFCSSTPGPGRTDEEGTARFDVELGPGTVEVAQGHRFHAAVPWSIRFEAATPETHLVLRPRPIRPVFVRVSPEEPDAELNPKDVVATAFADGSPRIVCRPSDIAGEPAPPGVEPYCFVAPDDVDVLVELRYCGTTQVVRLPPKARLAEFHVGPVYPVRWSAPHFPAELELRLSFSAVGGGPPALETFDYRRPGRGDTASGEVRLPPGRYNARLRANLFDRDGEDFFVDHERIVDVTPDRPAAVDFGP